MIHSILFVIGITLILAVPLVYLISRRLSYRHDVILSISGTCLIIIFYACVIACVSISKNQVDKQYISLLIITNAICVLPIIGTLSFIMFYFYQDWLTVMNKNQRIKLGK